MSESLTWMTSTTNRVAGRPVADYSLTDDGCCACVCCVLTFPMHSISLAQYNSIVETIRSEAPLGFDRARHQLLPKIATDTALSLRTVQGVSSSWLSQANQERERELTRDDKRQPFELYNHLKLVAAA